MIPDMENMFRSCSLMLFPCVVITAACKFPDGGTNWSDGSVANTVAYIATHR